MPGSPPINTNEPGTMPPPNTRFNSWSRVSIRTSFATPTSSNVRGTLRALLCVCHELAETVLLTTSSAKVFHAPHDGHLPTHLADSAPHSLQKKRVLVLAIENTCN